MRLILLAMAPIAYLAVACGGSQRTEPIENPDSESVTRPSMAADAAPAEHAGPVTLTEVDCERLLDHIFTVAYEDKLANVPDDQRPTLDDFKVAKDKLRPEIFKQCIGAERSPSSYDCAMSATTADDMQACMGASSGT